MKTKLNNEIPEYARAILYLCQYNREEPSITVFSEIVFDDPGNALHHYAEIPNPESQLVTGKDYEDLCKNLEILNKNMENKQWLIDLGETL